MNLAQLLEHFNRISEEPDAVARLRRFVLDLAVRGKLVEQDPNDEPAAELLKRIQAEKARYEKKTKKLMSVIEADVPFNVPASWEWVCIRQITTDRGQAVPKADFTYIDVTAIDKERGCIGEPTVLSASEAPSRARKVVQKGDVIYSCVRPYLLNIAIIDTDIDPPPIASTAFAVMNGFGLTLAQYLWIALSSPFMVESVEVRMRGQAYPAINDSDFALLPIPLPPLAEQHRIVAKVDELMALCDQLEAAQNKREKQRDRLVAASLHRVGTALPESLPAAARFHLDNLPRLTTRLEHIKQLRQAILNLAVRGRLVHQDPNDEPAAELLKRIQVEKARLKNEGKTKREKSVEAIEAGTAPFVMPATWNWARLGDLTELLTKGSSPKWQGISYVSKDDGVLFITSENVGNYRLRKLDKLKYVEKRFNEIEPRSVLRSGDILMNLVGASIGRTAIYDLSDVANINQAVALIRLIQSTENLLPDFLLHYFNSPLSIQFMMASQVVTAQPNISLTNAREFPIPVPPLAEQSRIVAKVDELMALCDQLEAQLASAQIDSRRLLEAVLRDALDSSVVAPG